MRIFTPVFLMWPLLAQTPGEAIRIGQAGYPADAPKWAMALPGKPASTFRLLDEATGKPVFSGSAGAAATDQNSGDKLQALDFSNFRKPGRYVIEIEGLGRSHPFEIGSDVFRQTFYLAMRSFYGQRCGMQVHLAPDFPQYRYGPCHHAGEWHASAGKSGPRDSVKGWHDAGDYGRYIVNSAITTGTLLWSYELFGEAVSRIGLNIPESKNATPDILDEIRWNLDWMLSMQDSDGGVFHKQTTLRFSGFVMPDKDLAPSFVIGAGAPAYKASCATGGFAAVMAIASRVYRRFDEPFAGKALSAAERAWRWLAENPEVLFRNPADVNTGAYGDRSCADERLWAAAELARTAGSRIYQDYVLANYAKFQPQAAQPPSWNSVAALGLWTWWFSGKSVPEVRDWSVQGAEAIQGRVRANPYRIAMQDADFVWGSNAVAANYGLLLLIAHRMAPGRGFRDSALEHLHYLLGRNAFGVSWVTQAGTKWFRHPHHRPSVADGIDEPWPGLLSGGPNRRPQDPAMRQLPAGLPPMRMWIDHEESYASNEIAINWNAPLVFLLAGAMAR